MNKIYNPDLEFTQLEVLLNKIIIKVSLNIENKSKYPLSLSLIREEVQKIIIISTLVQFKITFCSLSNVYKKTNNYKYLIDIFLKILLISSKQKIAFRLSIIRSKQFIKLKFFNSWLLEDIKSQEHNLFTTIINFLKVSQKKNSITLVESVIENFIIRLSDAIGYELFCETRFSTILLVEYSKNFINFRINIRNLKFYTYSKKLFNKKYIFLKQICNYKCPILVCRKEGLFLKNLNYTHVWNNLNVNQP